MPEIPQLSLKQIQIPNVTFNPLVHTPQMADLSLLQNSFAQREARMEKAAQIQGAIDTALGKIGSNLNEKENEWFANYKDNVRKNIQSKVDIGDFGNAIRTAQREAGRIAQDDAVLGRLKAQENYKLRVDENKQRVAKGEVSQTAFDWWIKNNDYNYTPSFDSSGRELKGELGDMKVLYNTINMEEVFARAAQMVEEEAGSTSKSGSNTNQYADGSGSGSSSSNSKAWHIKREENIRKNVEQLLSRTEYQNQLQQEFDVAKYELNEDLNKQNNSEEDKQKFQRKYAKLYKNGSPISYEDWYKDFVDNNVYGKNLSYERIQTETSYSSSTTQAPLNQGRGSGSGGGILSSLIGSLKLIEEGPNVHMTPKYDPNKLKQAQDAINGMFDGGFVYTGTNANLGGTIPYNFNNYNFLNNSYSPFNNMYAITGFQPDNIFNPYTFTPYTFNNYNYDY